MTDELPILVDAAGRPTRARDLDLCPRCKRTAAEAPRLPSGGFGTPWTVCSCGYEWLDRLFRSDR